MPTLYWSFCKSFFIHSCNTAIRSTLYCFFGNKPRVLARLNWKVSSFSVKKLMQNCEVRQMLQAVTACQSYQLDKKHIIQQWNLTYSTTSRRLRSSTCPFMTWRRDLLECSIGEQFCPLNVQQIEKTLDGIKTMSSWQGEGFWLTWHRIVSIQPLVTEPITARCAWKPNPKTNAVAVSSRKARRPFPLCAESENKTKNETFHR